MSQNMTPDETLEAVRPAARDVGVGKRHTAHAVGEHAAGRTAEDAQRFDALAEYGGVRAQVLH